MKLNISYDLIDKIKDAKTGFSLKRTAKRTACSTVIGLPMLYALQTATGVDPSHYITSSFFLVFFNSVNQLAIQKLFREGHQKVAEQKIAKLLCQLEKINIKTNYDDLLQATAYKTEYKPNLKKGTIEQKKYINVPVNDYWGEREISVCQEHTLGSRKWSLSMGEPKESKKEVKVYTRGMRKATGQ